MRHHYISIKYTAGKGRGMFADIFIAADTIIETAPVIVMTQEERTILDQTLLHDYIFEWQPGGKEMCCMALGYIPIYNHAVPSNCEYLMNYEEQTIQIKTVRDIESNEELTINYNGDFDDDKKVWFELSQ